MQLLSGSLCLKLYPWCLSVRWFHTAWWQGLPVGPTMREWLGVCFMAFLKVAACLVNEGRTAPCWPEQVGLLKSEGVSFRPNGCVDMGACAWRVDEMESDKRK